VYDPPVSKSELFNTTVGGAKGVESVVSEVPCLTVLYHPDIARIGERAPLIPLSDGESVDLSRVGPDFSSGDPLADPRLSRSPVQIAPRGDGGVRLIPPDGKPVNVDGRDITAAIELDPAALASGAVIELGHRVVLLLHKVDPVLEDVAHDELLGISDGMIHVRGRVAELGPLPDPVLIRGETGAGKELVARGLHRASERADAPLVALNMAAIPNTTAVSELFGHVAGSFSGADRDHVGFFGQADTGTIFLDEIGETSMDVQSMLLRALESGIIQPVGAASERAVDVRVVAATDRDLDAAIQSGTFRAPLAHRLAVHEVHLPPLRQRRDDIGLLLRHFLLEAVDDEVRTRLDEQGDLDELWLPASLVARLCRHPWPGNVRQLRNVARHLSVSGKRKKSVRGDAALERLIGLGHAAPAMHNAEPIRDNTDHNADFKERMKKREVALIEKTLRECGGKTAEAAKRLKMPYRTLAHKIRVLRIREDGDD